MQKIKIELTVLVIHSSIHAIPCFRQVETLLRKLPNSKGSAWERLSKIGKGRDASQNTNKEERPSIIGYNSPLPPRMTSPRLNQ